MGPRELEEMEQVDVRTVDRDSLVDIGEIKVDTSLPKQERWADFAERTGNPFCYICNGMVVKVSYREDGESLEDKLVRLIRLRDRPGHLSGHADVERI